MSADDRDILGKADALMRRHRSFVAGGAQSAADDVPLLTEVVDPCEAAGALQAMAALPGGEAVTAPEPEDGAMPTRAERMRELLAPLPPDIARAVENWLAATLPRLVARRLDGVADQVAEEVGAELRDSLPLLIEDLVRSAAEREDDL